MMTIADRLVWLSMYGIEITVTNAGRFSITGPASIVDVAVPSILKYRAEILAHLTADRREAWEPERAA